MPAHRLSMRKTQEILRLRFGLGQGLRQVAAAVGASPTTVAKVEQRAHDAGLACWPLPDGLEEAALEDRLFPRRRSSSERPQPDFNRIYRELKRKGVTLQLLWLEYRAQHPEDGYGYSRFCEIYARWRGRLDATMHQEHVAGDKLFVDFAGMTASVVDATTGEITEVQVFVAALGASDLIYTMAVPGQDLASWIQANIAALEFYGGTPAAIVPDNLKSAVTKPCYYEPDINPTYAEFGRYYDATILPARPYRPRDKAKVENAVLLVERWVLAPLRDEVFTSLAGLNRAMHEKLRDLNDRPLTGLEESRRELFEKIERPALRPLPKQRFEIPEWKTNVGIGLDYHVVFDHNYYSVPYRLIGERIDVRATYHTVECLYRSRRVAVHERVRGKGKYQTLPEHMPSSHRRHAEWSPSRIHDWAVTVGPETTRLVDLIMATRRHPEQGFRSSVGITKLAKSYGKERLEAACRRARLIKSATYKTVEAILKHGVENDPLPEPKPLQLPLLHENIRGGGYYH